MTGLEPHGTGKHDAFDAEDCAELWNPARLRALEQIGLTADSDERMEEFAQWLQQGLEVPIALVSLVNFDSQVFPGMVGLPEPWASKRSTPLSHSFCQYVVRAAEPLVITDARDHLLVRDNLAVPDLNVIAYAGMPLSDESGNVLGSLAAIDTRPRRWTPSELELLQRIAQACRTDLRLRLARYDANREENRRSEILAAQRRSFNRTQMLLLASQAFTDTTTAEDVRARIRNLMSSSLHPGFIGTVIVDERGSLVRVDGLGDPTLSRRLGRDERTPAATAIREDRILHYPNRAAFDAAYPARTSAVLHRLGLHTLVAVPLPGPDGPIGAIVLGWDQPAAIATSDLVTIASIAGYAGHALWRAGVLEHSLTVAHEMQNAMLTTLPTVEGLQLAARYQPADSREHVGGDWYDATPVIDPARVEGRLLTVSVGDVIGHALAAATVMGQVRSMLRQATWDHPGRPPSAILHAFETATRGLGLAAAGTTVIAHLRQAADGAWTLTWTNAGHPPPILMGPDGRVELLDAHDPLFGFAFTVGGERTDHRRAVEPGSTLFLYTDGLVERSGRDIDAGIDALAKLLRRVRHRPVQEIVDTTVDTLAPDALDDVVAFAIRFP